MAKFRAIIKKNIDGSDLMELSGNLNEDAGKILPVLSAGLGSSVTINFKLVTSINSFGVHAWIGFIRKISVGRSLIFEECTPEIVSQINMVPIFRANASINSVYAAFACPHCGHVQHHLFVKGKNMPEWLDRAIEVVNCARCGAPSEMDSPQRDFFAFLSA